MSKMSQSQWSWGWQVQGGLLATGGAITLTGCCACAFFGNYALAQTTPDSTLGAERSVVTPNVNINGLPAERIDGGATRGANLFHSFSEFNVLDGQRVYFANPAGIQNIISRVTGSTPSNILGQLGVDGGTANLFLINPGGIIFGPNARLDIGGSFVASTASSIVFPNGYQFSATNPQAPPLLTINVPIGLQYGATARDISVQQSSLEVPVGKALMLVGGDVRLEGGVVKAPGGRVDLGGLAGLGTVGLDVDGSNLHLSFPDSVARADVSLTNGAEVNVLASGGGSIAINARNLNLMEGSTLQAGIASGLGKAGTIEINTTQTISFDGENPTTFLSSGAYNRVKSGAEGSAGDINITAESLFVTNGADINTSTSGKGNAGNVNINAATASFDGVGPDGFSSGAYSRVESGAVGNGGSIKIAAQLLSVSNGAILTTSTAGKGDAGSVTINADTILFDGIGSIPNPDLYNKKRSSGAYSAVIESGIGNAGNITIMAREFRLTNGAIVITSTLGRGNAGTVNIKAGTVSFDGQGSDLYSSGAYSSVGDPTVTSRAVGNGGGIIITTGSLSITNGAQVNASTFGDGEAGNIQVNEANFITLSGVGLNGVSSGIFTSTEQGAKGKGGEITVNTNTLEVKDGAVVNARTLNDSDGGSVTINANTIEATNGGQVITTTRSDGKAGNITINAADSIILSGSNATFAERLAQFGQNVVNEDSTSGLLANTRGSGKAGDLKIFTGHLIVQDGAQVSAYTRGTGQAGTLAVQADSVKVIGTSADGQNPSQLFFDSSSGGNAGELTIATRTLTVQDGGRVSAATSDAGKGGILAVDASDSVVVSGKNGQFASGLYFDSRGAGEARGISINTGNLTVQNGGQVTVSGMGSGTAGDLQITANSIFLNNQGTLQATNTSGAGSIRINTGELTVQNGSQVTVSGAGSGVSGDLQVTANSIFLNNQGNLTAKTVSGEGGNIQLQVADTVWLRHNSNILTEALGIGNGGNITINVGGFVLAILPENSDVAATAIQGRGGNIFVTAQGVFGFSLPERLVRTPESDISAASQLGIDGTREINTPDNLPLVPLPDQFEPPPVPQGCQVTDREQTGSRFVITGRGGLPPNPSEALRTEAVLINGAVPQSEVENRSAEETSKPATRSTPSRLVEAQGWVYNSQGQVVLTAQAPTITPYGPSRSNPKNCNAP
jgi:filamentous hemagglutinin family protein